MFQWTWNNQSCSPNLQESLLNTFNDELFGIFVLQLVNKKCQNITSFTSLKIARHYKWKKIKFAYFHTPKEKTQ